MEEPQLSEEELMRQQEEKMKAKYGNLKPKKKLIHKDVKYFDSADYVLQHSREDPEHPIDAQEDVGNLPTKISSSPPKAK